MSDELMPASPGQFILFQDEEGQAKVECRFEADSLWLSQAEMCSLYGKAKATISEHITNIFEEQELDENSVVRLFRTTAEDGKSYNTKHYSLPVVIAVGYRVRSKQGTKFRQWATKTLQEYLAKGFVMDDERLRQADSSQYFDELLNRIRDIRSSEKVFWRKVCDIYATSIDYDGKAQSSAHFFAQVQNKMHWAAHGHTASEVVFDRIDADKPGLGLTSYQGKEAGKAPTRKEVIVGKNYLSEAELDTLNRLVTSYLEFAELQARNGKLMKMSDWANKLNDFLSLSDFDILTHAGKISAEQMKLKAKKEYDKYRNIIDQEPTQIDRDFENAIKRLEKIHK